MAVLARLRMWALRWLWAIALFVALRAGQWAYELYDRVRCPGTRPVLAWVPGERPEGGYHRLGNQRMYCYRFRWHRDDCLAPINPLGKDAPQGALFTPQPAERIRQKTSPA
jgi:hypothetical protein